MKLHVSFGIRARVLALLVTLASCAGPSLRLIAAQPVTGQVQPDSLVLTWDVRPLDLGYTVTINTRDSTLHEVHLPPGTTRYAWPIRLTVEVRLEACLERYRAEPSGQEEGGCETVLWQPPPELRLTIRRHAP